MQEAVLDICRRTSKVSLMLKITYNAELIKIRLLFETLTNAQLKDCFYDKNKTLIFVTDKGEIAKAIGKNGMNAKRMENALKRKIKIVEFSPQMEEFVANLIMPLKAKSIQQEGENLIIAAEDAKTRGMLIGRGAANLRNYEGIIQRYFRIKEIKVR